jgi:hypothetical protein
MENTERMRKRIAVCQHALSCARCLPKAKRMLAATYQAQRDAWAQEIEACPYNLRAPLLLL